MARIRTIKPHFFKSYDVTQLSYRARLTWIGLWTYCDDDGRGREIEITDYDQSMTSREVKGNYPPVARLFPTELPVDVTFTGWSLSPAKIAQLAKVIQPTATLRFGMIADYDADDIETLLEVERELDGLEDYPVIDDSTFEQVFIEEQELVVQQIAENYGVDVQDVWNAIYEVNAEFEWEQDYAYLVDEQAVLSELGV